MTVAERFAHDKIAEAAKAALHAGMGLDYATRRMEAAMAQAAVDKHGTKSRAAGFLGVHRNTMTRLPIAKQRRRREGMTAK